MKGNKKWIKWIALCAFNYRTVHIATSRRTLSERTFKMVDGSSGRVVRGVATGKRKRDAAAELGAQRLLTFLSCSTQRDCYPSYRQYRSLGMSVRCTLSDTGNSRLNCYLFSVGRSALPGIGCYVPRKVFSC